MLLILEIIGKSYCLRLVLTLISSQKVTMPQIDPEAIQTQ